MVMIGFKTADITTLSVDAIVNAANSELLGGGGVDGAIHRAAGNQLYEACLHLRNTQYPDGLPVGEAVITPGFNLQAKHVIHTVGPTGRNPDRRTLLGNAYRNSLAIGEKNGLRSMAFPAISTGIYGYPREEAADVVGEVLNTFDYAHLDTILLCYFSHDDRMVAEPRIRTNLTRKDILFLPL